MQYQSTRNRDINVTASEAITQGISAEGGLFVPQMFPTLSDAVLQQLVGRSYTERAAFILSLFLGDFSQSEILYCVENAYTTEKFASGNIAEITRPLDQTFLLELWHGPTCAFKDMALQILPYLLTVSAKKTAKGKKMVILVATSGDTGKAALDGFRDVPDTEVLVFYPEQGVSMMQKRQMITQEGNNVSVCAISGNFDDAQAGVKKIFTDPAMLKALSDHNMMFSSANSINWGRLLPQIVYYISSYCEMVKNGAIQMKQPLHVTVPTGNFGNILAAYYAKKMGVPFEKLICASNANNVLTEFIHTGIYNKNRPFFTTNSPSMDILISSNLERLLYDMCGQDDQKIRQWYQTLQQTGRFEVDHQVRQMLSEEFYAGHCDEQQTLDTIARMFEQHSYLCDTHTAVALKVAMDYQRETGDPTNMLVVSTANPYKFSSSVLGAICPEVPADEYAQIEHLQHLSKLRIPASLEQLKNKPVRFERTATMEEMPQVVLDYLGIMLPH